MSNRKNLHAVLSALATEYEANIGKLSYETEFAVSEALGTDDWEIGDDTAHGYITVSTGDGQKFEAYCYPRTPDLTIGIGDYVRSYDFVGDTDCYVEGEVTGYRQYEGCLRYVIVVKARVFDGKPDYLISAYETYPPVNGTPTMFRGTCRGVVRVNRPTTTQEH